MCLILQENEWHEIDYDAIPYMAIARCSNFFL